MTTPILPTALGAKLQICSYLKKPFEIPPYGAINDALTISTIVPNQPTVQTRGMEVFTQYDPEVDSTAVEPMYWIIGNGNHAYITDPDTGIPYTVNREHKITDSGLYHMIPFVVVPVANDLSAVQRQRYRLRKTMDIGGVLYAAYYARKLEVSPSLPTMYRVTVQNGTAITTPFAPSLNTLNPTPPTPGTTNDGSAILITSLVTIAFTADDVQALRDACTLLYSNANLAIISEIGFCAGVDKEVTARYPASGAQIPVDVTAQTYYESVGTVMSHVIPCGYDLTNLNQGFSFDVDLGMSEPLYGRNT